MKLTTLVFIAFAVQAALASTVAERMKVRQIPSAGSLSAAYVPGVSGSAGSGSVSNYLQSLAQSATSQSAAALNAATSEASVAAADSIPATKLIGGSSSSSEGSSSACQSGSCSGNSITWGSSSHGGDQGMTVSDAVRPIDEWMKDFKARTANDGADLLAAAKMTIAPLLQKLKRNQFAAVEKLKDTNEEILRHVEEVATEHVYNLLRAQRITDSKEDEKQEKKIRLEEVKAEAAEKEAEAKMVAEHSEGSHSEGSHSAGSSGSKF